MPCSWPRNAAGGGDDAGVAAELAEPVVDVDEQAAAARPRPIVAIRILAWRPGVTVLPFSKVSAPSASADISLGGRRHCSPRGPDLINWRPRDAVHLPAYAS